MDGVETDINGWKNLRIARDGMRYPSREIIKEIFNSFLELHGDRLFGDDKAIIGGLALLGDIPVTVIAQNKGIGNIEKQETRSGMALPEGYRKALRLMKQANKFGRTIICFINTPGAYPGIEAETRGQAEAIAKNISEMSSMRVPIISIIFGEGGSGGALALAVANKIYMLENSIFSVVSPEACASILWRDAKQVPKAAQYLKITSSELLNLGIIDDIVVENGTFKDVCVRVKELLKYTIKTHSTMTETQIIHERKQKYREIGKSKEMVI